VICGNKTDVGKRVITEEEAQKFADSAGIPYFETTAKEGINVTEMFHALFAQVVKKINL
jgi:hypothetical protein